MKTLYPLVIFLVSQTITMATDSAPPAPPPEPQKEKASPYRQEARRLMEAFEKALEERRDHFKERLLKGDTRLIDVENLSGYAHLNRDEMLQQTHNELAKGREHKNPETPRRGMHVIQPKTFKVGPPRRTPNQEKQGPESNKNHKNSEMHRRGGNSKVLMGGVNVVQPKTFNIGPPRRTPGQGKQGPGSSKKPGLPTQKYDFSHHISHKPNPQFRHHHNSYHEQRTDNQFRVPPVPNRGRHFSKQDATHDFVPAYHQQGEAGGTQPHRHPYHDNAIDSSIDRSRDSRGRDVSGHFDSHDDSYPSHIPFYKNEHPHRRPHVISKEEKDEYKPRYRPQYVSREPGIEERPEVDFIGSHDTDRKTPTGKSFRLESGEDDEDSSIRHEQRKHPGHHRRIRYKPSFPQEADSRKRSNALQISKPKFPPVTKVAAPAAAVTNSVKTVFRPLPRRLEKHIEVYNPQHHTLPVGSALQGVTAFYNGTQRECYSCSWQPAVAALMEGSPPVGWDRCRYAFHHTDAAIFSIRTTSCIDNCYVRVDPDNSVHRGCYRGEEGVSPQKLGCHKQGPKRAVYCFCRGGKCNSSNAPAFY